MRNSIKKSLPQLWTYFLMVVSACACIWIYKNHNMLLNKIIMRNPHYIILQEDPNRKILQEGTKIVDIKDLQGAPGRAMEQGGATLVFVLPEKAPEGKYYIRLAGYVEGRAAMMTIKASQEEGNAYTTNCFITADETEYTYVMNVAEEFDQVVLSWQSNANVPTITDFQMRKLPAEQDVNELTVGVAHKLQPQEVILTEENIVYDGFAEQMIEDNGRLLLSAGDCLIIKEEKNERKIQALANIKSISYDNAENVYLILENGDIQVINYQGDSKIYNHTLFGEKPVSVSILSGYWFVAEGYGGVEIFKTEGESLKYISNMLINNIGDVTKIAAYNHSVYIMASGNVYCYDISILNNPVYRNSVYVGGNAADMRFIGNKLYVATVNNNWNLDKDGNCSGNKGNGYYIYEGSLSGAVEYVDGWKQDGYYVDEQKKSSIDVYGEEIYYSLYGNGVNVRREPSKQGFQQDTNIQIKIRNILGEELGIKNSLMTLNGLYILAEDGKIYLWKIEPNGNYVPDNTIIKTEERPEEYKLDITFNDENTSFKQTIIEQGKMVKHIVTIGNQLLVVYEGGISLYDIDSKEKLWEEAIDDTSDFMSCMFVDELRNSEKHLIVGKGDKAIIYSLVEEQLRKEKEISTEIGNLNSYYATEQGDTVLCGENGIAIYGTTMERKIVWKGIDIKKVVHESDDGYFLIDKECLYWYLEKNNYEAGVRKLSLISDDGSLNRSYDEYFVHPVGLGYRVISTQVYETENGLCTTNKNPQVDYLALWDEVEWRGFHPMDMNGRSGDLYVDVNKDINKVFVLNVNNIYDPQRLITFKVNSRIYDVIIKENKLVIAAGREGVIVFEKDN